LILAAVRAATGNSIDRIVAGTILSGALLHVAGAAFATRLAFRVTQSAASASSAGVLLALATPLTCASFSGMEVPLTGLLLLLAVDAFVAGAWTRTGIFGALSFLSRPESGAVVLLLLGLSVFARLPARHERHGAGLTRPLIRIASPFLLAGALLAGGHLWASGTFLPATYHGKTDPSLPDLPRRLTVVLGAILPRVPALTAGLGWFAILGFLPLRGERATLPKLAPLCAGFTFLLANALVIDPVDPAAFYHVRYLLPAVPLLLTGLAIGAHELGKRLPGSSSARTLRPDQLPILVLLMLAFAGASIETLPQSRRFHNDVRNINEVQRSIGDWLRGQLVPGTWIAASDAGAVRYFSELPTIDVLGLNTPAMLAGSRTFVDEHPVAAIAIMPAWFRSPDMELVEVVYRAETRDYTVTSNPQMGVQLVLRAKRGAAPNAPRIRFVGFRNFEIRLSAG
jgi:hypothetical protein